jgi:hypothetical protein
MRRRLERLDLLIGPYLRRREKALRALSRSIAASARNHIIILAGLVLYGEPKLDEPLEQAWARCVQRCKSMKQERLPFEELVRLEVQKRYPDGSDEDYQNIIDSAPHWLLRFTSAWVSTQALGLKLPDLSDAPPYHHLGFRASLCWPNLPKGTLQTGSPLPREPQLTTDELLRLLELRTMPDYRWTLRDHRLLKRCVPNISVEEFVSSVANRASVSNPQE